jgi:hypothetical protein
MLVSKKKCQHKWKIVRVVGSRFALASSKNVRGIATHPFQKKVGITELKWVHVGSLPVVQTPISESHCLICYLILWKHAPC